MKKKRKFWITDTPESNGDPVIAETMMQVEDE